MDPVPQESFPKCYPVISPRLMKPEWGDSSKFHFNPAFDLGFPELTDPDHEHYATLLDRISDLDVLFGDDPLKPKRPPSKRFDTFSGSFSNCTINVSLKYVIYSVRL